MIPLPQISIRSQAGRIGISTEPGQYDIRTRPAVMQVESTPPSFTADNGPGTLVIDKTLTDNALTGGKPEAFWQRIYSQYQQVARQNLERIVAEGNEAGDLRIKGNIIADQALDEYLEGAPDLQIYGFAAPDNTKISYTPRDLNMEFIPGSKNVDIQPSKPEIEYRRGSVNIYMQQYPNVTVTAPSINIMA